MFLCLLLVFTNTEICYAKTNENNLRLDVDDAWRYSKGRGVNVAIIDTGADLDDPAIKSNIKGVYKEHFKAASNSALVCASGGNTGKLEHHYPASYDITLRRCRNL